MNAVDLDDNDEGGFEDEGEFTLGIIHKLNTFPNALTKEVIVNKIKLLLEVDSGFVITVICYSDFLKYFNNLKLNKIV